jgi:protein required for attachment to host cells
MKHPKLCYVIADGGRARFVLRDKDGAYRTVESFVSTDLHKRAHELGSDRPGRVQESANAARHAAAPRSDPHEAAKEDFIRTVGTELAHLHGQEHYDQVMLVAPPGVIGELRASLSAALAKLVVKELHKDLTKVPDHELTSHLPPPL